ncbi:Methyltransferase-like protein 24 [Seminavis robusta]|uniref:Methyltransferase-like protein 24 n=1 Tax=Seminavis robusta TaxID=568900 RepID=A0A9N8ELW2_9STRA|nr:Methyltransferase-like protein 24 [Seminavis robusta]|eukprot:Sro1303_g261020.1 Methyltransferase-like protein 24 (297) ;mRNA; r:21146-22254
MRPESRKNGWKVALFSSLCMFGGVVIFFRGETDVTNQQGVRVAAVTSTKHEDWRGAPIGDREDDPDSYHSYDHRPAGTDPRDVLLNEYTIHPCPNGGTGSMVSGQDPRLFELKNDLYKERNPKFLCDAASITTSLHQPCVVYSFGSFDEISFEIGIDNVTNSKCDVHTFDPEKRPSPEVAGRHHFTSHDLGLSSFEHDNFKRLGTIMKDLGHKHIHVLKIDIEGGEGGALPALQVEGVLKNVDQISIEFHSVELMKKGLDILVASGFGIVYARREDRCAWCIEVTLVKMPDKSTSL